MKNQSQNKTQPTTSSVERFISSIEDENKRMDAMELRRLMEKMTGQPAVMWGSSIIGFDKVHYKYESGREGDMGAIGFSPRRSNLTIYFVDGVSKHSELLAKLGPHKTGKASCLYIKRLSDIDMNVLEKLIKDSYQYVMSHKYEKHRVE